MKEKILKDLPVVLNGFAIGWVLFGIPNIQVIDIVMSILAMVTFIWYGKIKSEKQSGGGMVDADVQIDVEFEFQHNHRFDSCPDY